METIASDAMAGRETASPGHKAAADYVAAEFRRAGLEPGGASGSYLQPVKVKIAQIDEPVVEPGDRPRRRGRAVEAW